MGLAERLRKDLHDNVTRNHRCEEMDELMQNVDDYLESRRTVSISQYLHAA